MTVISPPIDGRTLRTVRTREAVVRAFLDLVEEGVARPTAQQVSHRSGVSMASLFRLFDDVDALHAAAVTARLEQIAPLLVDLPTDGPLTVRITALVTARARLFEAAAPVRRIAVRLAPGSPPIGAILGEGNRYLRAEITRVFAFELSTRSRADRAMVLDAIDASASWETWERMRTAQGLSAARARNVLEHLIAAMLGG
jgi:TetR/AcrR family transcriptional regulator, regulator of autoinduction and epiphytic fitness